MADDQTTITDPQGTGATAVADAGAGAGGTAATTAIVVDKNKAAEQYIKEAESLYIIPLLVRETFPDLIKLIYETESMNTEEREYWLQIMPIMTEEQIKKFRDILVNEKQQLDKLDQEYEQEMSKINQKKAPVIDEKKMKEKIAKIKTQEKSHETEELEREAKLLEELEGMED